MFPSLPARHVTRALGRVEAAVSGHETIVGKLDRVGVDENATVRPYFFSTQLGMLSGNEFYDVFAACVQMGNLLVAEDVLPERFLDDFTRLLRRYRVPVDDAFPLLPIL